MHEVMGVVCVCVCFAGSERKVGGLMAIWVEDSATVMVWCLCFCVWLPVLIKSDTLFSLSSLVLFISSPPLSPLPSVSDWGEELSFIHCSTWMGQNQQVSSLTSALQTTLTCTIFFFSIDFNIHCVMSKITSDFSNLDCTIEILLGNFSKINAVKNFFSHSTFKTKAH